MFSREHKEQFSRLLEDLPDPAKPHYDVEIFKVISHVFAVATNQKVITDKETADILWEKYPREVSNFTSIAGRVKAGIKCTYKANEAYLYPLGPAGKCFLSLFKQPMSIPFRDIASITCSRVAQGTGAAALRTFEIRIAQRNGPDLTFGNVSRDDYPALEEFAKKYSIKVRAEMAEDTRVLFGGEGQDDSASEEEGGSRKRKRTTINAEDFGDDEDSDGNIWRFDSQAWVF